MAGNIIRTDDATAKNGAIGHGNSFYFGPTPTLHLPIASSSATILPQVHTDIEDVRVNSIRSSIGCNSINLQQQHQSTTNCQMRPASTSMVHFHPTRSNHNTSVSRVGYCSQSNSYSVVPMASLAMLPRPQMYHGMNLFNRTFEPTHNSSPTQGMPFMMNNLTSNGHFHSLIVPRAPMINSNHEASSPILSSTSPPSMYMSTRNVKSHPFTSNNSLINQPCNSYSIDAPLNGHSVGINGDSSNVTSFSMSSPSSPYKPVGYNVTISNGNCIDRTCSGPLTSSSIARGQGIVHLSTSEALSSSSTSTGQMLTSGDNQPTVLVGGKSKSVQVTKSQMDNSVNTFQYLPRQCKCHNFHDRQSDADAINCHLPRNTTNNPIVTQGTNKSSLNESMVIQLTPTASVSVSKEPATTDTATFQAQSTKANINDSASVKGTNDKCNVQLVTGDSKKATVETSRVKNNNSDSSTKVVVENEKTKSDQVRESRINEVTKRRNRHTFSPKQISVLEKIFDLSTHYPDTCTLVSLSKKLKLPIERIQVWFQNRRAKYRRGQINCNSR